MNSPNVIPINASDDRAMTGGGTNSFSLSPLEEAGLPAPGGIAWLGIGVSTPNGVEARPWCGRGSGLLGYVRCDAITYLSSNSC